MKKLSLFLENGKNEIYLDGLVRTKPNSKMRIRNATVYWNFKNIIGGYNNVVTSVPNRIVFEEGYWDFHMIAGKLAENGVEVKRIRHDNTCTVLSKNSDL